MYSFLAAIIGALRGLKRTCPGCGKVQLVPKSRKYDRVKCMRCGAEIPPASAPRPT